MNKTIAALATAPYGSGVAIIRISGPESARILSKIFIAKEAPVNNPRMMFYGELINNANEEVIDHIMAVFFKGPNSFTGEDTAELYLHGSPLLCKRALRVIYSLGATPAEPGEFSRRAFENGKLDLLQAEAVGDLIAAESEQALQIANQQLAGKFSTILEEIGEPLRNSLAELEAHIDFPDEDIEPSTLDRISNAINLTKNRILNILGTFDYGKVVKEGYRVLICGRPNAGKSSLLNSFLATERAIVTDISGTTRDLIEETADISGYKFVFCDSAGITETEDQVEKIGIELALKKIDWANLVLLVVDATSDKDEVQKLIRYLQKKTNNLWLIINKIDLNDQNIALDFEKTFPISVKNKQGLEQLKQALVNEVENTKSFSEGFIVTNERQREALISAENYLNSSLEAINKQSPLEVVSVDLRSALKSLDSLIGVTDTEDILGKIFSKFCIGK